MSSESKGKMIAYWVTTALTCLGFFGGGIGDVLQVEGAVVVFNAIQMPVYIMPFIGVAKLLAVFALLMPGFRRAKEWAYAGIAIDLLGATYCHISVADGAQNIITPLVFFVVAMASWYLRPASRRLTDAT